MDISHTQLEVVLNFHR